LEILSIQTYSDILNTRDERYLKFALLLLKSFYEYFFEYSREREFNSLERDWILFVCWKLLRNALLLLVFIEAEIEKLTWNIHEHTTVLVRPKTTHVLLLLLLEAQGCKKCVFPSEECSEEHSLLSSHLRQPTWGCSTAVLEL